MANGWYGSSEEWQRLERPLQTIDPILEDFAATHHLQFSKNAKGYPERSLRWGDDPSCLLQVYLEEDSGPTGNLWLCCSEDRGTDRYWCNDFAVRDQPIEHFRGNLPSLLKESFRRAAEWRANPEHLQFATHLSKPS